MRWIVYTALRFRYLVIAGAVALMFFGAQTLGHQKVDVFPEFAPVSVEIQTECLGLSPSEVESLVTVPLENALQGVPRVTEVESESVPQLSAIFLYFKNGTDVLQARQLVQERLAAASPSLPSWAAPPAMYPIVSATSRVMQVGITSKHGRSARPLEDRATSRSGRACCMCPASPTWRCGARRRRRSRSRPTRRSSIARRFRSTR